MEEGSKGSNSIDELVASILDSNNITKGRVTEDITQLSNPYDVLDYIDRIRTFVEIDMIKNGAVTIEESLPILLSQYQQEAIKVARTRSERDDLTGLYNRGMIDGGCNRRNPQQKYTVLMLDIDYFKRINDTYGHIIGDLVIKNVARLIQESVRESFVSRYGGDEFYVELNQTNKEGGRVAAERIRKAVEENAVDYVIKDLKRNGIEVPEELKHQRITLSMGVADEQQGKTPYEVRDRADKALYEAKKAGKNMVILDKPRQNLNNPSTS